MTDAHSYLQGLEGQLLHTLTGRPNRILEVRDDVVIVATGRSPGGKPVQIAEVQDAIDALEAAGELEISVATVGYRSAFIGAVLATLPGATTAVRPRRVILRRGR